MGVSSIIGRLRPSLSRQALLALFLLLLLLVLNVSTFVIYRGVRSTVEAELGERLLSVASVAAAGVSPELFLAAQADPAGPEADSLRAYLTRLKRDTGLGGLYLFTVELTHLLDPEGRYEPGQVTPSLELHTGEATAALAGVPNTSELYRVGGVFLETAFAPVLGEHGEVLGGLAVEGGSGLFEGLLALRRQVFLGATAGLLAVLALSLVFARLLRAQALAERTLRETSALAAAGELAAILAHEIRNPLTIISSRAERVRAKLLKGKPASEVLEWFEAIPREVERLDRVLSQYLRFARPGDLEAATAPLGATIDAVLELLTNEFARKAIEIDRHTAAADASEVAMAPTALHQVLLNLLLNARDAMPEGGRVDIEARESGREVVLAISDTGQGMSPEVAARAFEPFFTTKAKGSGLGLAVVRSMLDLYGAEISVRSSPGEGTTFTLRLPRVRTSDRAGHRPARARGGNGASKPGEEAE